MYSFFQWFVYLCPGMVHSHRHRRCWCNGQNQHSFASTHCLYLPRGEDSSSLNIRANNVCRLKHLVLYEINFKFPLRDSEFIKNTFCSASSSLPLSPQVFVLSGVIAMVTCAVFLRLNSLLKLAVLLLAVAVYSYLIHLAFLTLTRHDMMHRSHSNCFYLCVHLYRWLIHCFITTVLLWMSHF